MSRWSRSVLGALPLLLAVLVAAGPARAGETTFGGTGSDPGQFSGGPMITVAPNGHLYTVEPGSGVRVQELTVDGTPIRAWGSVGNGDGQFMGSYGIAVGPSGDVYVGDYGNDRLQVFSATGTYLRQWPTAGVGTMGVAVDADEHVWVTAGGKVTEYDATGTQLRQWGQHGAAPGELWNPSDLAIGTAGDLYEVESNIIQINRFSADGAVLASWGMASGQSGDGNFRQGVAGVDVLPGGDVLVANSGRVSRFTPGGAVVSRYGTFDPDPYFGGMKPQDVAADAAGNVFIADGTTIRRLDTAVDARLTVDRATRQTSQPFTFDAGASAQPLGAITRYDWDLDGDGAYEIAGGPATQRLSFATPGAHTVGLRVSGSRGPATTTTTRTVDVQPSSATLTASTTVALTGQAITLDATGSALPDATIAGYAWDLDGDGAYERDGGTSGTTQVAFPASGAKRVGVRVTRAGGRVDTAALDLDVRPAPPAGELGVSIDGGAVATNDPNVTLTVVWPALTTGALIANDGGFGAGSRLLPVATRIPWRLTTYGDSRTTRVVYLRFRGAGGVDQTYSDDIILDETAPTVASATIESAAPAARASVASAAKAKAKQPPKRRTYTVRVSASDAQSGVVRVEVSSSPRKAGKVVDVKRTSKLTRAIRFTSTTAVAYVRAEDAGGNFTKWRKAKAIKPKAKAKAKHAKR